MWPDDNQGSNQSYKFTVTPDYFRENAQPGGSGMRFSRTEIIQILISVSVLTVAFAIALSNISELGFDLVVFEFMLGASFVAVFTGFLLHELSHKILAQKYGCFAEFRMSLYGLFLGLITSFLGFLFALPGAVMISGRMTVEQNGKISLAGPGMNMIIGSICLAILFVLSSDTLLFLIFSIVAYINLWLAIFNLLPIPPLDGSKVFYWNKPIYVASMALAVALFIFANMI